MWRIFTLSDVAHTKKSDLLWRSAMIAWYKAMHCRHVEQKVRFYLHYSRKYLRLGSVTPWRKKSSNSKNWWCNFTIASFPENIFQNPFCSSIKNFVPHKKLKSKLIFEYNFIMLFFETRASEWKRYKKVRHAVIFKFELHECIIEVGNYAIL